LYPPFLSRTTISLLSEILIGRDRSVDVEVGLSRCCGGRVESALVVVLTLLFVLIWPGGRLMPGTVLVPVMVLLGGQVEAGRRLRVWWKRFLRTEDWDMFGMVCEEGIGTEVRSFARGVENAKASLFLCREARG
jgi:hypothetical protein